MFFFDQVRPDEVAAAYEIEVAGFPPDEAASLDTLKTRQANAPELFLGAYTQPRTLIAYADATLANSPTLTADSMHTHDPTGTAVCIHGLAVVQQHRRTGVASALLKEYIHRLHTATHLTHIILLCHSDLIPLYTKAGFTLQGQSPVVHGSKPWFEMRIELTPQPQSATIPPNVLAALTNPSSRARPVARPFSSFSSTHALLTPSGENAHDILCPRPGCGSVILKSSVAKHQRGPSLELEPPEHDPPPPLQRLPPAQEEIDWWLITPSPMAFENIAFSRPVRSKTATSQMKFLACAECDLGAFGWSSEGGREFWLAASRVGYR